MACKVVAFAALVAVARAGVVNAPAVALGAHYAAPVAYAASPVVAKAAVNADYDPNPSYVYGYNVHDALTGDSKSQQESRQGDVVQGSYSLTEPDGSRRTVHYTADPVNGFNAVVDRQAPVAVQKAVLSDAPVLSKVVSPVGNYVSAPAGYAPVPYAYHV